MTLRAPDYATTLVATAEEIVIPDIPQDGLCLRVRGRFRASAVARLNLYVNGNTTGTNYDVGYKGVGFAAENAIDSTALFWGMPQAGVSDADLWSTWDLVIPYYAMARRKVMLSRGAPGGNKGSDQDFAFTGNRYHLLEAVEHLAFVSSGGPNSLVVGCSVSVWRQ